MKVSEFISRRISRAWMALMMLAMTLTSCDVIYDDEGDCTPYYYVNFVYDMNMKFADAFAPEVNDITLYVFDKDGTFVSQQSEQGDALKQDGYRMALNLSAGKYTLVAWGGIRGELGSYSLPQLTAGTSKLEDLTCRIAQRENTAEGAVVKQIDNLYHGMLEVELPDQEGEHVSTVSLTKNTNNVRVVLQNTSGQDLNASDFVFTITDDNGWLNYDNNLLQDETLFYRPFDVREGSAGVDTGDGAITSVKAVVAETTVSRLVKGNNPILTITKAQAEADGSHKTVLRIPLIDYALLVKGYYNRNMDDQEYLDRQDEYNMVFFLDNDQSWMNAYIYINSWRVVLSDVDMK